MAGSLRDSLVETLRETGRAHHAAFGEQRGEDPDWPIWYAERLQEPLSRLLETDFTRSRLIYCLMSAEFERAARAEDTDWASYYAAHLEERFAPSRTAPRDVLTLYYFPTCPFCVRVLDAIRRLALDVELRDVRDDDKHRDDLVAARGRATVPVLKIVSPEGVERWMPESADIIRYLERTYG